ncbi:MAG: hypothetical protein ACRDFW_09915, partial [bacterium]
MTISGAASGAAADSRQALGQFRRHSIFFALVVLLLALGIGAATTLYSIFDAVLLRPLPVREPERLVRLVRQRPGAAPLSDFRYGVY